MANVTSLSFIGIKSNIVHGFSAFKSPYITIEAKQHIEPLIPIVKFNASRDQTYILILLLILPFPNRIEIPIDVLTLQQ